MRGVELEACINFLRPHAAVTRQYNAELLATHGLTINDFDVLAQLARAPERALKRVELAERVLLTPSGITRLLEGLERHGYVERAKCASDARVTYALLTDAGFAKLREASETHLEGIRSHFAERFSGEELDALGELLTRLELEAAEEPPDCSP